jgi:hypothetical protein
MAFLPFILRRARRHWQILLTLSLGVVLTTALLASGPLLVDTVVEMGLHLTLQSSGVADGNLRLATSGQLDRVGFQALDGEIETLLQAALGEHLDHVTRSAASEWMLPWVGDELATDQRVNLRFYEGIQDHIEYVAGEWPGEASGEPTGLGPLGDAGDRSGRPNRSLDRGGGDRAAPKPPRPVLVWRI